MRRKDDRIELVKLILRSSDSGHGWRNVGPIMQDSVMKMWPRCSLAFDIRTGPGETMKVRLTEFGYQLVDWIK